MNRCSFKIQMPQISFQSEGQRSNIELLVILSDLQKWREVMNELHDYGTLLPTPLNGKTWEEEKKEFYDKSINAYSDLLSTGDIRSCEVQTACTTMISQAYAASAEEGVWCHIGRKVINSSEFHVDGDNYSLDDMIRSMRRIISGTALDSEIEKVNEVLDNIGRSACEPRAFLELEQNPSGVANGLSTGLTKQKNHFSIS